MGQITRPSKTAGTTQFSTEVAAGADDILAAEVDAELNTIVAAVNNLDDGNLSPTAGISTSKIAQVAGWISTTSLADLGVTLPKLAVGATLHAGAAGFITSGQLIGTTETPLGATVAFVSRGGLVVVFGSLMLGLSGNNDTLIFRLYRDADVVPLATWQLEAGGGPSLNQLLAFPVLRSDVAGGPGSRTYRVTGQVQNGTIFATTSGANSGLLIALEFA